MEFTLYENGTDSLKKSKESLDKFDQLRVETSYHLIKDSIIYLNHGTEILLKYILSNINESLIFTDIETYIQAKKEVRKMPKPSGRIDKEKGFGVSFESVRSRTVFDVPARKLKKQLKTVSLYDTLERIEYLCDIEVSEELKGSILKINEYRNKLTHHTFIVNKGEIEELITTLKTLYSSVLNFFGKHIQGIVKDIDLKRYEITQKQYEEWQEEMADFYHERAMSDISADDMY